MKNILRLNEFPYLLTIIFTLLGWTFTKISDKITKLPTIEYALDQSENKLHKSILTFSLINLTDDKQFKNVGIRIEIDSLDYESKIEKGVLIAIPPASRWTDEPFITSMKNEIQFKIPVFNPGCEYQLQVFCEGTIRDPVPSIFYFDENQTESVILKKSSFFTFIVKNDLTIYLALFVTLCALILLYFHYAPKFNKSKKYY